MHTPTGRFNSHVDPAQMTLAAFRTRLYGEYNQRGPFLYPRSPYDVTGNNMVPAMGDIVPMSAMQPIDAQVLFTDLPSPTNLIGTSTAPIGSAGWPTFRALPPATNGTILGPAGSTIPTLAPASTGSTGSMDDAGNDGGVPSGAAGTTVPNGDVNQRILNSFTSPYGNPAPTIHHAKHGHGDAGPITYTTPFPSIIQPAPPENFAPAPSFFCQVGQWVNANPLGAALGAAAVYFMLRGGKKR